MAPDLFSQNISFIGGGNMAAAIISGLINKGFDKRKIHVSEPWDVNRDKMSALGVRTTADNDEAARGADIIILAVKPQVAKGVCQGLAASVTRAEGEAGRTHHHLPLLVSIAAGITRGSLRAWCTTAGGASLPVVRVMPNTPALLGEGASGLFAGDDVSAEQKVLVSALMDTVSKATEWVDREELMDVVTGVSGSGPAYFFAMVEHLIASGTRQGLSEEQATRLAKQTCFGAGKMLVESTEAPAQLRKNVTSPNGTTQAALESFEASGFAAIVDRAVEAATKRGEELGKTLGEM